MSTKLTAKDRAALNRAAGMNYAASQSEYYVIYYKRGSPDQQVAGPFDGSFGASHAMTVARDRKTDRIVQRKKTLSCVYGEFELAQIDKNGDIIEDSAAHALARWLVSLDNPDDQAAMEERGELTLADIIKKAREALGPDE
ncbi:hypothetical protein DQ384_39325 [Sphaerisporangium album]|uniref:Uncharacterized protein n=1 Tax=Sphaerisporangium album TaxID=509200 RepID=A0A367EJH5_9ACTN|nr:hypothetical protein [Sphaerisporangium album]RCG18246.1 hypothetical protein DQ384_39325 [Sphaerisporangium album]